MAGRIGRVVSGLILALAAAGCGADLASSSPVPTDQPTIAPIATATTLAAGPLSGTGPLDQATYETPAGFSPSFLFEMRSDAWRSATPPDAFGFALVTPNLVRVHGIIALARPASATMEAFEQELTDHGLIGSDVPAVASDRTVGGVLARSFTLSRTVPADSFAILTANGETVATLGGPLSENRIVYVGALDGPMLLLLSIDADGAAETRYVFESLLDSIRFK